MLMLGVARALGTLTIGGHFLSLFFFSRMKFTICLVLLAGSTLLVRCYDPLSCDVNTAQKVRIAAGELLKEALVSENYPNNYPNNACQRWEIMADENQVHFVKIFEV